MKIFSLAVSVLDSSLPASLPSAAATGPAASSSAGPECTAPRVAGNAPASASDSIASRLA